MPRKYAPRVKRRFYVGREPTYPSDNESLHGRYRPLTAAQLQALGSWSHRDFSW